MSHVMRKPVYAICEQQRCRSACASAQSDQHLVVRCLDSIIPLVSISEISSLYLAAVAEQAGLCLTWWQIPKTGFLLMRLILKKIWLCWGLTSQSTIFQSYRDGAIASWVSNQYFRGVKCLAQGHNTAVVGFEPRTPLTPESDTLPLSHRAPHIEEKNQYAMATVPHTMYRK